MPKYKDEAPRKKNVDIFGSLIEGALIGGKNLANVYDITQETPFKRELGKLAFGEENLVPEDVERKQEQVNKDISKLEGFKLWKSGEQSKLMKQAKNELAIDNNEKEMWKAEKNKDILNKIVELESRIEKSREPYFPGRNTLMDNEKDKKEIERLRKIESIRSKRLDNEFYNTKLKELYASKLKTALDEKKQERKGLEESVKTKQSIRRYSTPELQYLAKIEIDKMKEAAKAARSGTQYETMDVTEAINMADNIKKWDMSKDNPLAGLLETQLQILGRGNIITDEVARLSSLAKRRTLMGEDAFINEKNKSINGLAEAEKIQNTGRILNEQLLEKVGTNTKENMLRQVSSKFEVKKDKQGKFTIFPKEKAASLNKSAYDYLKLVDTYITPYYLRLTGGNTKIADELTSSFLIKKDMAPITEDLRIYADLYKE